MIQRSNYSFRLSVLVPLLVMTAAASACSESEQEISDPLLGKGSGGLSSLGLGGDDAIIRPRPKNEASGGSMASGGQVGQAQTFFPLERCQTPVGYSRSQIEGPTLLDDFESGEPSFQSNGRVGYWYTFGDGTGTIVPNGQGSPAIGGRDDSLYALHIKAQGFTDWGSGAGTGLASDGAQNCLHDLSVYNGVSFWARGHVESGSKKVEAIDEGVMRLSLVEFDIAPREEGGGCSGDAGDCWDGHRVRFPLNDCWTLYSFDFSEFEQDGWGQAGGELDLDELFRVNFESAAYNDWEMWLDDVSFYQGAKPTADPECTGGAEGGAGGQ